MNTVEIKLNIDETILLSIKERKEEYRKGKLSLGKAAQLANYDRLAFIKKMQEEGEYIFNYETDLVDEMIAKADIEAH